MEKIFFLDNQELVELLTADCVPRGDGFAPSILQLSRLTVLS
jgi:hypothetical protein